MHPPIVLASSSPYRRELLARLGLRFLVDVPGIDERPLPGEGPQQIALRLSIAKAQAVAQRHPEALVIGSDQVAECNGHLLGKPGDAARALAQLQLQRGRTTRFHSGLALVDAARGRVQSDCIVTEVAYRDLDDTALAAYVETEKPFDCAGAARIEALGISLVQWVRSDDPTALIGLPLIRLTEMLAQFGLALPLPNAGAGTGAGIA